MSWTRRNFLGGAAGSLVLGGALRTRRAEAQNIIPRRLVLFFTPHGTVWDRWRPTRTQTGFTLPYILEPLVPYQSCSVILDGIGMPGDGPGAPHTRGPAVLFTGSPLADDGTFSRPDCSGGCSFGWNTYHSVDQEVARSLSDPGAYRSLEFGVRSGGGFPGSHISYQAPGQPAPAKQDPYVVFQQLFAGRLESEARRARTLTRRRDAMAAVQADLAALRPKASTFDRQRLEAHAQSISEIQRALELEAATCALPGAPEQRQPSSDGYRAWAFDRQIDMLAASLACGLTRVASLQFRPGENDGGVEGIYSWLGQTSEHHLATHDSGTDAQAQIAAIYRWYTDRFAYLLGKLDSYAEADGTLLDHTMVVWGSEIGEGTTHRIDRIPFVVAGGSRAGITGGKYLEIPGTMNHRLLVSMLHFMGFRDRMSFGTLDQGMGPLPGLVA